MPNPKLCAICGVMVAVTRDHIPPRSIFPRPLPVQLITVPACSHCNNGAAISDEIFRVYLAVVTAYFDPEATRAWKEGALRTLDKNPRIMRDFVASIGGHVVDEHGVERLLVAFPAQVYNSTCERIVRGLFYQHHREAPGARMRCIVTPQPQLSPTLYDQTHDWHGGGVGESNFVYRFGRAPNSLRSLWILQFFRSHWAAVETIPFGERTLGVDREALLDKQLGVA